MTDEGRNKIHVNGIIHDPKPDPTALRTTYSEESGKEEVHSNWGYVKVEIKGAMVVIPFDNTRKIPLSKLKIDTPVCVKVKRTRLGSGTKIYYGKDLDLEGKCHPSAKAK